MELSTSANAAGISGTIRCVLSRSSRSRRTESIRWSMVQPGCAAVPSDSGSMSLSRSDALRASWGLIRDMSAAPFSRKLRRTGSEPMGRSLRARSEFAPLQQGDVVLVSQEGVLAEAQDRSALAALPVGHAAQPDLVVGVFVRPGIERREEDVAGLALQLQARRDVQEV